MRATAPTARARPSAPASPSMPQCPPCGGAQRPGGAALLGRCTPSARTGRHRCVPPPARPVADAPVAALVDGADGVARDWLVELVGAAPLARAGSLPMGEIA